MTDLPDWVGQPLASQRPLIAYIDFKSPYAYLAVEPTRALARECGIAVDWRPLVLDIPSFLGSAKLDNSGRVSEQKRSPEQWSSVKYAYFDCRRYANLRGLTVRGTIKIWDCELAAVGMLWAKQHSDEILDRYLDAVYDPFWRRELDIEDVQVVSQTLAAAGADTAGFAEFLSGEGRTQNAALQQAAFKAGIFGVPTFVVNGQCYFGREHLPRIRWHLQGESGSPPDIAYPVAPAMDSTSDRLEVFVDFASPLSYLALAPTLTCIETTQCNAIWHPAMGSAPRRPLPAAADDGRPAQHRRLRSEALATDIQRYAPHPLSDLYLDADSRHANMGFLWVNQCAPASASAYVAHTLERYWRHGEPIDTLNAICEILSMLGLNAEPYTDYARSAGADALARSQDALRLRGVRGTPTYFVGDEPFLGRHHLPLITTKLRQGDG